MNDANTEPVSGFAFAVVDKNDSMRRPTADDLHRQLIEKHKAEEAEEAKADEETDIRTRKQQLHALTIDAMITKVWFERIHQVRGESPEIGERDIHIKTLIIKTLMTIERNNPFFSTGEFESLGR
jgi:hypothetical protein